MSSYEADPKASRFYEGKYDDSLVKFFKGHPYQAVVEDRRVFKCDDHITAGGSGIISTGQPIIVVRIPAGRGRDKIFVYCDKKCHLLGARQRPEAKADAA